MASGFFEFQKQIARTKAGGTRANDSNGAAGDGASTPRKSGVSTEVALTVSELTSRIKNVVEKGFPSTVHVKGEVSNFRNQPGSGHWYFTLKDEFSCIDCVMFNSQAMRVKFMPDETMELLASGRVEVYAPRGKYQLNVQSLQPVGAGALELAFKQMRERLAKEGLFAPERKRPVPAYPLTIAIVTSAAAAAYQDVLKVLRRFGWLRLMLYHVPVQGDGAGQRIADAIRAISDGHRHLGGVDVILLVRGGGSLEDLWSFNEESVGRAIFTSTIPVITGIGHEVDTSIADLVADYFAHTPTEAAQVLTQHWRGAGDAVDRFALAIARELKNLTAQARSRLRHVERHEFFRRPADRIESLHRQVLDRERALSMVMSRRMSAAQRRISGFALTLARHSPDAVLARLRSRVDAAEQRLTVARARCILRCRERLARQTERFAAHHPRNRLSLEAEHLAGFQRRLNSPIRAKLEGLLLTIESLQRHLHAIGPDEVLRRGYSITMNKKTGQVVRRGDQVREGDRLITRVAEGQIESIVEDPRQPRLFS